MTVIPKIPLESRTLKDFAYLSVRRMVLDGTLAPGRRVLADELSEALEMSITPIREALNRAAAEGLVKLLPHVGAEVPLLSLKDLENVIQVRLALEVAAFRLIAERIGPEPAQKSRARLAEMRAAMARGDWDRRQEAHRALHQVLLAVCGNSVLQTEIMRFFEVTQRYFRICLTTFQRQWERDQRYHEALVDALADRNPNRALALTEEINVQQLADLRAALAENQNNIAAFFTGSQAGPGGGDE